MGWEWRYFVRIPLPDDGSLPLEGKREDIYFPAGEAAGLKLRNGRGDLEVKLRIRSSDADGSLPSPAEYWDKNLHAGSLVGQAQEVQIDGEACARAVGKPAGELFVAGGGRPQPVRVLCRKHRHYCRYGEEVDCVFIAIVDGQAGRPALVERFRSVSVEGSIESIAKVVKGMGPLPEDAIVAGYPTIVQSIAHRALSQSTCAAGAPMAPAPAAEICTASVEGQGLVAEGTMGQRRQYRVLQSGDIRSAPSSSAPQVGRLVEGSVLQSSREQTSDGRVWIMLCGPGAAEEEIGWTAMTKRKGEPKLALMS